MECPSRRAGDVKRLNDRSLLVLLLVGILFYWAATIGLTKRQTAVNAITQAGIPDGYRYFYDFMNGVTNLSAGRWRRPVLDEADLRSYQTFFLVSPKRPLSDHEAKVLTEWVENGGKLVLSFRDEA